MNYTKHNNVNDIIKDNFSFHAFWTEEDEWYLRSAIYDIRSAQGDIFADYDTVEFHDSDDLIEDELDDIAESMDDLVINIDNIFDFDLEDPYIYNKYDRYFFIITTWILLLQGYILFCVLYILFGLSMATQLEYDEEEAIYMDELMELDKFSLDALFTKIGLKKPKNQDLIEIERFEFANKCLFHYRNIEKFQDDSHLDIMKKNIINDYYKFVNNYYNMIIVFSIKKRGKTLNKKIYFLKNISEKESNLIKNKVYIVSTNLYLSDFDYNSLNEGIFLLSSCKHLQPYKNIKIKYLII